MFLVRDRKSRKPGVPGPIINSMLRLSFLLCFPLVLQVVSLNQQSKGNCNETVRPNLVLRRESSVAGRIMDKEGSPLKGSRVELRRYISQAHQPTIKTVQTNGDGAFDLGKISQGRYRLLPSPTRAFRQPDKLQCTKKECQLSMVLEANPTDQPYSICPVK